MGRTIEMFYTVMNMDRQYTKDLVSIVTPCYNTGSILHRLFDSVLSQDYPYIEMYAINDGSTDDTEEKIKAYIPKFKDRGYTLECINQPNGGQSSALNNGLKLVKGEFFIWPDSDDYFSSPQSISRFVEVLKTNEDISVVRCLPTFLDEVTLKPVRHEPWKDAYENVNQFYNCLYCKNFFWGAGDYMIKMEAFDHANPSREIYVEKKAGQNWQILLPALYGNGCKTLKEHLLYILERSESHCRANGDDYEKQKEKYSCYDRTVMAAIDSILIMESNKKQTCFAELMRIADERNFELAIRFKQRREAIVYLKKIWRSSHEIKVKNLMKYFRLRLLGQ